MNPVVVIPFAEAMALQGEPVCVMAKQSHNSTY
jgi:hypothetical protein